MTSGALQLSTPIYDGPDTGELSKALATADGIASCVCSPNQPERHQRMAQLAHRHYQLDSGGLARFVEQTNEVVREQASLYSLQIGELPDYETILARANAQLVNRALDAARSAAAPDAERAGSSPPPRASRPDSLAPDGLVAGRTRPAPSAGPRASTAPPRDSSAPRGSSAPPRRSTMPPRGSSSRPPEARPSRADFIDPVTKTYTRAFFHELIQREYLRCARDHGTVGMLCVAIDQHAELLERSLELADRSLVRVARLLREAVSESDALARSAEAEFSVMLLGPDAAHLKAIAERVRSAVADAPLQMDDQRFVLTVSVGAALASPDGSSDLYRPLTIAAGDALSTAQRAGGNRVCVII